MAQPNAFTSFARFVGDNKLQPVHAWLDMFISVAGAQVAPLNDAAQRAAFLTLCEASAFQALRDRGLHQPVDVPTLRVNLARVFCPVADAANAEADFQALRQAQAQPITAFAQLFARANATRAGGVAAHPLDDQVGVFRIAVLPKWREALKTQRALDFNQFVDVTSGVF